MLDATDTMTESERYLGKLCSRTFLRLWSWPHVYRDQRFGAGSEGKEVCDLLVVFGDDVIVFSDKNCAFPTTDNLALDWSRWFKRAVRQSALQAWGAERWLREHPDRVYLDPSCTKKLPLTLPTSTARYHRVVVAHGAGPVRRSQIGGSDSLVIDSRIVGEQHFDASSGTILPFGVGRLDPNRPFVHVIGDASLDVVLLTLDTAADFVRYLKRREDLLTANRQVIAPAEEELLGLYLRHVDGAGEHVFLLPDAENAVVLDEGFWESFQQSPERRAQVMADRPSYAWDKLIDSIAGHVLRGTLDQTSTPGVEPNEKALRIMAAEPRFMRRSLATSLFNVIEKAKDGLPHFRVVKPDDASHPFYVFLGLAPDKEHSYEEYRDLRRRLLYGYILATRSKFPKACDIVGIASEAADSKGRSEDIFYFDGRQWTPGLEEEAQRYRKELGFYSSAKQTPQRVDEYPVAQRASMAKGRNRNQPCSCGSGRKAKRCCGR